MTSRRARTILVLMSFLVAAAPSWAQSYRTYERDGAFRLRVGLFQPEGDSEYWAGKEEDFSGDIDDFENVTIGGDYLWSLSRQTGLLFSGGYFEGDSTNSYLDFVDNFGNQIRHDTTLQISSLTVGFHFQFTGPDAVIIPYLAAGGGLYFWNLEEAGDFIDFGPNPPEVFTARLEADGVAPGYFGLVGVEVPFGRTVSLFAEGRWTQAEDELEGDLPDLGDIDLSGREFSAGLSWSF